jgi:preprotein translocase subunit SecF
MIDIVGKRFWYLIISLILITPGVISMVIPPGWSTFESGLRPGIDFTSGSVLSIRFEERSSESQIKNVLSQNNHPEALIQRINDQDFIIRTKVLSQELTNGESERELLEGALSEFVSPILSVDIDTVSPIIAKETIRNTFIALSVACIFILAYIWYAFRKAPNAYRFGISAILALVHDLIIVVGVFSILGRTLNIEVNSMFIIGILTVVGYSVNDTIVVFDRIRENSLKYPNALLSANINLSICESIGRSVNTSFTTILVILAMLIIGGSSIRELLIVVAVGVAVGTYSSIFVASQFLVFWDNRKNKHRS